MYFWYKPSSELLWGHFDELWKLHSLVQSKETLVLFGLRTRTSEIQFRTWEQQIRSAVGDFTLTKNIKHCLTSETATVNWSLQKAPQLKGVLWSWDFYINGLPLLEILHYWFIRVPYLFEIIQLILTLQYFFRTSWHTAKLHVHTYTDSKQQAQLCIKQTRMTMIHILCIKKVVMGPKLVIMFVWILVLGQTKTITFTVHNNSIN